MSGFEPTSSCLTVNCAKPCATSYVLIGDNRVSQFNFSAYLTHFAFLIKITGTSREMCRCVMPPRVFNIYIVGIIRDLFYIPLVPSYSLAFLWP